MFCVIFPVLLLLVFVVDVFRGVSFGVLRRGLAISHVFVLVGCLCPLTSGKVIGLGRGWLIGRSILNGRSIVIGWFGWLVGWLVGRLVRSLVGSDGLVLIGRLVCQLILFIPLLLVVQAVWRGQFCG